MAPPTTKSRISPESDHHRGRNPLEKGVGKEEGTEEPAQAQQAGARTWDWGGCRHTSFVEKMTGLIEILEVSAVFKAREELLREGVEDGAPRGVFLQITFGDVGALPRLMHQHMVPRLVLGGLALGHLLVPVVGALKGRVHIVHHAPVVKAAVVDELADGELAVGFVHRGEQLPNVVQVYKQKRPAHPNGTAGCSGLILLAPRAGLEPATR